LDSEFFNSNEELMEGWAHKLQIALKQVYTYLIPNMTSASVLGMTMLRRSWSMYVLSVYNICFSQQLAKCNFLNGPHIYLFEDHISHVLAGYLWGVYPSRIIST
jgi:hypothetical protein